MNTLQDLRHTLDREARALQDDHVVDRTAAVRGRVRAVRRRRAAAVVAAAAVAVAGVAVGVTGGSERLDGPDPASPRLLAGTVAPAELTSVGWTFAFDRGVEADGAAELRLEASDEPRLVTWATEGDDQAVVVQRSPERPWPSGSEDFTDFVLVRPGFEGRVAVTGTGGIGVAVYELTDDVPPGVTAHGVTFREPVAGRPLLGAEIAEPGTGEVELDIPATDNDLMLAHLCSGGERGLWRHLSVDGREVTFGAGCDDDTFDPGTDGVSAPLVDATDGLTVRLWVTRGMDGPVVEDPEVLLGLGVYEYPDPAARVAGQVVDEEIERDGHLWRLVDTVEADPARGELTAPALDAPATLVAAYFAGMGDATLVPVVDGKRTGPLLGYGDGSALIAVLPGDGTAGLRVQGEPGAGARIGLGLYERVD